MWKVFVKAVTFLFLPAVVILADRAGCQYASGYRPYSPYWWLNAAKVNSVIAGS